MKALKIVGIAVLTLVAVFFILAVIAPNEYRAERSITIDAPKEIVFEQVKYWKNWHKWSPWAEMDNEMKISFAGEDGKVGSKYIWKGNPELTGEGEMTNTGVKENEEITYDLHFIVPWESESKGYTRLKVVNGKTEVSWGFYGEYPFPANIMLLFVDMQEMMQNDFDRGLELLKKISEEEFQKLNTEEEKPVEKMDT